MKTQMEKEGPQNMQKVRTTRWTNFSWGIQGMN